MTSVEELLEVERRGWDALSSGGEAAAAHFAEVLADEALFLLPGGLVLDDRRQIIDSVRGDPWTSYRLSDARLVDLGEHAVVLAYRASATRDETTYVATMASTYAQRDGAWRLVAHQQTPD